MNAYETTAKVEAQGEVHLAGLPFAPGTEVDVHISLKAPPTGGPHDDASLSAARERMRELFSTIKGFRNIPRIPREELYDRGRLR